MVKTQKRYYLCNTRSGYFPINRRLHRGKERGYVHLWTGENTVTDLHISLERERETGYVHPWNLIWYYLCNMRSGYFPINRSLHRDSKRERWREQERERLCPSVKQCKHRNSTISVIQDLDISLSIGDCIEREREAMSICEMVKAQKLYYVCIMRSGYFPINRSLHWENKWERESKRGREREWADRLSGHFILKYVLIYYFCVHCILVTSSDNFVCGGWG